MERQRVFGHIIYFYIKLSTCSLVSSSILPTAYRGVANSWAIPGSCWVKFKKSHFLLGFGVCLFALAKPVTTHTSVFRFPKFCCHLYWSFSSRVCIFLFFKYYFSEFPSGSKSKYICSLCHINLNFSFKTLHNFRLFLALVISPSVREC